MPAIKTHLPTETYDALQERARQNGRTLEEQVAAELESAVSLDDYRSSLEALQRQAVELNLSLQARLNEPDLKPETRAFLESLGHPTQVLQEVTSDILALVFQNPKWFARRLQLVAEANAVRLAARRRLLARLRRHAPPGRRPFNAPLPEALIREDRER